MPDLNLTACRKKAGTRKLLRVADMLATKYAAAATAMTTLVCSSSFPLLLLLLLLLERPPYVSRMVCLTIWPPNTAHTRTSVGGTIVAQQQGRAREPLQLQLQPQVVADTVCEGGLCADLAVPEQLVSQ